MDTEDFKKTWGQIRTERRDLADRRTVLETELLELNTQIAHLDEVMNHLAPLAGMSFSDDGISGLGFTDAVRAVLRLTKERKSAQDVRSKLTEKGFSLTTLSAPMASLYKILSRLVDANEISREKDEDGRVYYRWNGVTDDDIPF